MTENGTDPLSDSPGWRRAVAILAGAERSVFTLVGALFFIAAFAVAVRSTADLWALFAGPHAGLVGAASAFLDGMLLVLMMVELAYTVTLSLRGAVLVVEPFLIVALIAVIRRLLVITVGGVNSGPQTIAGGTAVAAGTTTATLVEPALLTAIVFVLVGSLLLVRWKRVGH